MSDDWDISTGDGSVTLYLPPDFGAELDARTSDGGIRNELQVASQAEAEEDASARRHDRDENSRRAVSGRIGGRRKASENPDRRRLDSPPGVLIYRSRPHRHTSSDPPLHFR